MRDTRDSELPTLMNLCPGAGANSLDIVKIVSIELLTETYSLKIKKNS